MLFEHKTSFYFIASLYFYRFLNYFFNLDTFTGVSVSKSELVRDVSVNDGKATVTSDQGHTETVDAVVLTLPVPQILQLQGSIQQLIGEIRYTLFKLIKHTFI